MRQYYPQDSRNQQPLTKNSVDMYTAYQLKYFFDKKLWTIQGSMYYHITVSSSFPQYQQITLHASCRNMGIPVIILLISAKNRPKSPHIHMWTACGYFWDKSRPNPGFWKLDL